MLTVTVLLSHGIFNNNQFSDPTNDSNNETQFVESALKNLFAMQSKIFKKLVKLSKKNPDDTLKQLDNIKINSL